MKWERRVFERIEELNIKTVFQKCKGWGEGEKVRG